MSGERVEADINELVERSRQGDRAAFGELARLHQHEVYTLAVRLVGDRTLAADVTQEALVRAWKGVSRFRGDSSFSTWLYRVTVNVAWTLKGRAARQATYNLDDMIRQPHADSSGDPEVAGERAELRANLKGALGRLPDHQRSIVILKDVYGWSHKEIAQSMSISVTASKVRLHRAHLRLRELLRGVV
jgi:RNA polymerase sigma-70 factor (ECF subfamily)